MRRAAAVERHNLRAMHAAVRMNTGRGLPPGFPPVGLRHFKRAHRFAETQEARTLPRQLDLSHRRP
jgi:hypothetical protein